MEKVRRHRTAIARTELSRPLRAAFESGLLDDDCRILDYGCGRGDDVERLRRAGFSCEGWDPVHRSEPDPEEADVVNLGYVVNVIEDIEERRNALRRAWELAQRILVVAARLDYERPGDSFKPFRDGFLTSRGTFQKLYSQQELRAWIEATLGVCPIAVAPGVFFVFRDDRVRRSFSAARYRRAEHPLEGISSRRFEEHRELLEPLMEFFRSRGRLPADWEIDSAPEIRETFGSLEKAFLVVRRVTGAAEWERLRADRAEDFLVYLALERFGGRQRFSELPEDLRLDVRAFFGTYRRACEEADALLFSAGDMDLVNQSCRDAEVGKLTRDALYVHGSGLPRLPAVLRVYEGCARNYLGRVDGANIFKLWRREPKVTYSAYPDFDEDPHPALVGSLTVGLRNLEVRYRDFSRSDNPPILHRKELFVPEDHERREEFARLTRQEEELGLYEDPTRIGWRRPWEELTRFREPNSPESEPPGLRDAGPQP